MHQQLPPQAAFVRAFGLGAFPPLFRELQSPCGIFLCQAMKELVKIILGEAAALTPTQALGQDLSHLANTFYCRYLLWLPGRHFQTGTCSTGKEMEELMEGSTSYGRSASARISWV